MATLLVATTGGHLDQLDRLAGRLEPPDDSTHWVTSRNEQSRSLLDGRQATFVPYVGVRDVRGIARCLPVAHGLFRRHGITRAVSTGSGIALGFLPYLAARGVECHYIESAARVTGPSLTGRILQRVPGVSMYTQSAAWARPPWSHVGSVFDSVRAVPRQVRPAGTLRVVVTLGTATEFPFRRMVEALVPLLGRDGALVRATGAEIEVLWQTGGTPTDGLPIAPTPFLGAAELAAALDGAHLVVCHAGTGSALGALGAGIVPVLVPRRHRHGEAGDDHQSELADELARRGLAIACEADAVGPEDLLAALTLEARAVERPPPIRLRTRVV